MNFFEFMVYLIGAYFFVGNTIDFAVVLFGMLNAVKILSRREADLISKLAKMRAVAPVTIIVPCYNEEANIINSIKSMLSLNYPSLEVIVVNDGSKDRSISVIVEAFQMSKSVEANPGSCQRRLFC